MSERERASQRDKHKRPARHFLCSFGTLSVGSASARPSSKTMRCGCLFSAPEGLRVLWPHGQSYATTGPISKAQALQDNQQGASTARQLANRPIRRDHWANQSGASTARRKHCKTISKAQALKGGRASTETLNRGRARLDAPRQKVSLRSRAPSAASSV